MILEKRKNPRRKSPKKRVLTRTKRDKEPTRTLYPKGAAIRISGEVLLILSRKQKRGESWDQFFRRMLNIPQRTGEQSEPLFECWVLPSTGQTAKTKSLARGLSLINGALKGHAGKFEEPRKVRETV